MFAIEANGISRYFGKNPALSNLSLNVDKGSIHAILGPNGSGKTTFVRACCTLLKPDAGSLKICGFDVEKDPNKVRDLISLTGQSASIDEELTGYENLYLMSRLLGLSSSESKVKSTDLLDFFGLKESGKKLVKNYSGGMRRKLDLAVSMIKNPEILFLDEPTTGLDPRSRNHLWYIIRELAKQGTTILLTTQYLEEADQLAEKITVIDKGTVISQGTSDQLKASIGGNVLHVILNEELSVLKSNGKLQELLDRGSAVNYEERKLTIPVDGAIEAIELLHDIRTHKVGISFFEVARPTLDEVFLTITGKPIDDNPDDKKLNSENQALETMKIRSFPIQTGNQGGKSSILTQCLMFGWRGILKIKHIPEQFLDVLITPIMFTFMFTYIFGGALEGSTVAYLNFLIPGILVQTLVFNSMYAGMNIHTDVSKGIFDRFRSMPIWHPSPLAGIFIGDFFRYLISGLVVLGFSMILGFKGNFGFSSLAISFLVMIVFAMSLSWLFIIIGLLLRSSSAVMSVGWMLLMPIVFLSNIFVNPTTMPNWLQTFISYNPLAWQVDAVRALLLGEPALEKVVQALTISVIIGLVLSSLGIYFYRRER